MSEKRCGCETPDLHDADPEACPNSVMTESPIETWSRLQVGLNRVSSEYLKSQGFTWAGFKQVRKDAEEQARGLGFEELQTQTAMVQVVRTKQYASRVMQEVGTEIKLRIINQTTEE